MCRCHQLLSGFLPNDHLPRISRLSANGKGDNEMIPGTVHRSHGIYLTAEGNSGKPLLEDHHEGCATSHRLKWGPLPPNDVSRTTQHVSKREGRKKLNDRVGGFSTCCHGAMGCNQKSFKVVWRATSSCPGSYPMTTCPECRVCQLMVRG